MDRSLPKLRFVAGRMEALVLSPLCSRAAPSSDCHSRLFEQMYIYLVSVSEEEGLSSRQMNPRKPTEKSPGMPDIIILTRSIFNGACRNISLDASHHCSLGYLYGLNRKQNRCSRRGLLCKCFLNGREKNSTLTNSNMMPITTTNKDNLSFDIFNSRRGGLGK